MWTNRSKLGALHRRPHLSTAHCPYQSTPRAITRPAQTSAVHTTHTPYYWHCSLLFREELSEIRTAATWGQPAPPRLADWATPDDAGPDPALPRGSPSGTSRSPPLLALGSSQVCGTRSAPGTRANR